MNKYSPCTYTLSFFQYDKVTLGVLSTTCSSNIQSRVSLNRFFEGGVHMYSQELAIDGVHCGWNSVHHLSSQFGEISENLGE